MILIISDINILINYITLYCQECIKKYQDCESLKNKKSILQYKIGQKYAINVGGSVVRLQESKPEFKYG